MSSTRLIGQFTSNPESFGGAQQMPPSHRQTLALQVLGRARSVSALARDHHVSRKFLSQQATKAQHALEDAFAPSQGETEVLFWLPVTKAWLRQLVLALVLICHASFRGVVELVRDLFDTSMAIGTVHNIVQQAVVAARQVNAREDLSAIRVGAHDEIFQNRQPILVGCDVASGYCYLLAQEEARDATTWGVHLLDLHARGLHPSHTLADFGKGLRAGQAEAWPEVPCWGDHFHLLWELTHVVTYLENRAYRAMATRDTLEQKMMTAKKKAHGQTLSKALAVARQAEAQAIALADDVALLVRWLRDDILAVIGPDAGTRAALYDFVVAEMRARQGQVPHRLQPVVRLLEHGREAVLAFAVHLDARLARLAETFSVAPSLVHRLFEVQGRSLTDPHRWQEEAALHHLLGEHFYPLQEALSQVRATTYRASAMAENLNSRLRNYFFLRKHLGKNYLDLLRFFLNHRRLVRSAHPERAGHSPAESLTGQEHPHWLSLLGFTPFKNAA